MFVNMDVVFKEHEPFYGEPVDLTDVFPDSFPDDVLDNETGGEKGEDSNSTTSREVVVGVIPQEDSHDDRVVGSNREGQGQMQGEQQGARNEVLHWPRSNEEQKVRVYTRRHRVVEDRVRGEKTIPLGQNPEDLVQRGMHDSSSSPSENDGTLSLPLDDLDIPIARRK